MIGRWIPNGPPPAPLLGDIASAAGDFRELLGRWLDANDPQRDKDCDVCQELRSLWLDLATTESIDE